MSEFAGEAVDEGETVLDPTLIPFLRNSDGATPPNCVIRPCLNIFSVVLAIAVDETWRVLRDEFELDDCLVPHVSVEMTLV